jgi:DNA modification methylase
MVRAKVGADQLVVDPYCGSASTGVAQLRRGGRFLGIEIDPAYLDIAARRLSQAEANGVQQPLLLPREPGAVEPAPSLFGGAR